MQEKLRCAVIGSGFAGSTFAEAIRYAPEAQLVAIVGGHQAPDLAARHGVCALPTSDVDRFLASDEVDAVLIASPNPFHAPQAIRAARAGKHIFVEKPMGMNVAECRAMIDAADAANVTLMPGHMHRYRRAELAVKLMLQRGTIGRVDMASITLTEPDETSWLNTPVNGGYLLGSGVHAIDLLRFWLGDVVEVTALTGQYRGVPVENGSQLLMVFAGGSHAAMQNSVIPGLSRPSVGSGVARFAAELTGETGVISVDMYGEVRLSTESGWQLQTAMPVWDGHYSLLRMETFANMAREFVRASREQRRPAISAQDGLAAVAVVQAAHLAAAERRWVRIDDVR
ncbi:MAG: Gfo/Idh/MocA family oxidoreductase [Chloroflexi bacterium]|nr:Gfo/Idh/MocA family oxidoreductase [Chloroflexota bacterium]